MVANQTHIITLSWQRYRTFFDLWHNHRSDTKLVYVIGASHHCYIGSIGSRGGIQGLGTRYQWQYVRRAQAIFGLDESGGQESYAANFTRIVGEHDILATEAYIQNKFILSAGTQNALFEPEDLTEGYEFLHINQESAPAFIHD